LQDDTPRQASATVVRRVFGDPAALSGLLLFALLGAFVLQTGGYKTTTWSPAALVALLLAALTLVTYVQTRGRPSTTVLVAWGFLIVYVGWCFTSLLWAADRDAAWQGANRNLFYLACFVCAATLPWRAASASILLMLFGGFVAVSGWVALASSVHAADRTHYFQLGRFAAYFGYQNAACACFLMAVWPAIHVASRRSFPIVVRGAGLATACVLPQLALLSQSRTSLVAAPAAFALYLALAPQRSRVVVAAAVPAVVLLLVKGRLLAVYPAFRSGHNVADALATARNTVAVSAAIGLVAGLAIAAVDRWLTNRLVRRSLRMIIRGAAVAGAVAAVAIGGWWLRHPIDRAESAWTAFTTPSTTDASSYFSGGFSSNRHDFWRVAMIEFRAHPAHGVGVDNFQDDYLRLRKTYEEPQFPHSLEVMLISQTGVLGALWFAGFFLTSLFALRRLRRISPDARALTAAAMATVTYWLIQASADWFWEIPALAGGAVVSLGLCVSLAEGDTATAPPRPVRTRAVGAVAAVAVVAAAATIVFPWLSAAETAKAAGSWSADPNLAYRRLDTARRLNPYSAEPDRVAGAIASRLHDWPQMRAAFTRALQRDPRDWYSHLELAVEASQTQDWASARRHLAAVRALDPMELVTNYVAQGVDAKKRVNAAAVDQMFLDRIRR
jgi:O-antigen ligase